MPQRILSPGVAEVEMVFMWAGQIVENVFHVGGFEGAIAPEQANLLAATFSDWWQNNLINAVSNTVALQAVKVTDLGSHSGTQIVYTTGLPVAGTKQGTSMPNNVTVTTTLQTALRGRSFRGRSYYVGLGESDVADNLISVVLQNILQQAIQALITDIANAIADTFLAVLSEQTNNAMRPTGVATPVISAKVDRVVDSQRRRLPGRGR